MTETRPSEDEEFRLIERIAVGDRDAFHHLYADYERRLLVYLVRMTGSRQDAEDLMVEVMMTVWQDAVKFKKKSRLSTWIFGIAHNKAMNALRKKGHKTFIDIEEAVPLTSSDPDPHLKQIERENQEKVKTALDQLSVEHREVIELTFYHEKSCAEIAAITRCPEGTVKTRMFYARQRLRQILARMGVEGGHASL
ncbi:MAG: sigma-70 family RNA polymerase sigma factor [Acidobacteriota bacterium]